MTLRDITEDHAVLGVMGPGVARPARPSSAATGLADEEFPFATSREVTVAGARLRATRMTYVGELGWELMVPVADAGAVHAALTAGGAVNAGYYAIESLRLEKGYRAFGRELTPDLTPVEAGLVFATALKGDKDFLGRAALVAHRELLADGGPRRRRRLVRRHGPGADAVGRRAVAPRRRARRVRSPARRGARRSARPSAWPCCAATGR